jgi:uncharacterized membrane protein
MMRGVATILLWLWCTGVWAQNFVPTLHEVTGVATNDVLNIRQGPSASTPIVGAYAFNRQNIEVIGVHADGKWAQVGIPEGNGWVALRFLRPTAAVQAANLNMQCFGTEPFWSLDITAPDARFEELSNVPARMNATVTLGRTGVWAVDLDSLSASMTAIITARACSDGMSDRRYGWALNVLRRGIGAENAGVLTGCCTLERR